MTHSIEITSIDDQIPLLPQTEKDEIEEGSKVDHSIYINQIFAKKFEDLDNSSIKSRTIFKVNVWQRESNPDAYTPKMVSIGPYHKGNVQLHPMEEYKVLFLRRFLGRKGGLDVGSCIKELEGLKEKALKCYDDVETDEFCQMLLLDGCFVIEFIRECCVMCPEGEDKIINDNIFGYIVRDLLLLENQLPFFVLDKLHDMTKRDGQKPLAELASIILLPFDLPNMTIETFKEITGGNFKHLLHLKHALSCQGNLMKKPKEDLSRRVVTSNATELSEPLIEAWNDETWPMVMPNATQLSEAGVKFNIHRHGTSIFDIKFENGLMSIPQCRVTLDTETILRNFIAYEQQSVDVQPQDFSNFAVFMNNLIESDADMNLLCHKGIIVNWLGDNKKVANLFNKISSGVTVSLDLYWKKDFRRAVKYCKSHRMRAVFVHYFFKNALTKASTVLAFIAFIFTCIQTFLAFTGPLRK